jgi:hypothetical protein
MIQCKDRPASAKGISTYGARVNRPLKEGRYCRLDQQRGEVDREFSTAGAIGEGKDP